MNTARLRSPLLVTCITIAAVGFVACESSSRAPLSTDTPQFEPDAGAAAPPQECGMLRCSRDLKSVLRVCEGKEEVIERCSEGLGCGDGRCVDACTSAELSKGSTGCSFWAIPPEETFRGSGSCFVATVTNTWDKAIAISAEHGDAALDISKSTYTAERVGDRVVYTRLEGPLPPGGVALVFLSEGDPRGAPEDFISCPTEVVPALRANPLREGTTIERAFHLKTDAPVSAYSIYPYGGARSMIPAATLLLPVSSWGTNYVAITAGTLPMAGGNYPISQPAATTLQIIADEDDTEVRIRPTADIDDGDGVPGTAQGFPRAWKLSRGQVLQFVQMRELTGSALESNKRVGVFGGTECTFIPSSYTACDVLQQQIPALSQWGSEYALVPYPTRIPSAGGAEILERVPWRLVGAVDGTRLTYDPARPLGAPETLAAGESITFLTQDFVVVKSQDAEHPFYAGLYMTGAAFNGIVKTGSGTTQTDTLGDPDYVNVVPTDQFLDRYVFFADYTYPETGLTIVRRKTQDGFRPVELDCAGEVAGFRPLGASGEYEFAWLTLTSAGIGKTFAKGTCNYGRHEAHSDGPFSITVWGTGQYASYGFAGGMGSRPLNPARVPVPH